MAKATIEPGKYWFNINDLENQEVPFDLRYKRFDLHSDEFKILYTLTTTTGEVFSQYVQYYNYNTSPDGRLTGRYAQFYTNLPGFGTLVIEVRQPYHQNPNEQ